MWYGIVEGFRYKIYPIFLAVLFFLVLRFGVFNSVWVRAARLGPTIQFSMSFGEMSGGAVVTPVTQDAIGGNP